MPSEDPEFTGSNIWVVDPHKNSPEPGLPGPPWGYDIRVCRPPCCPTQYPAFMVVDSNEHFMEKCGSAEGLTLFLPESPIPGVSPTTYWDNYPPDPVKYHTTLVSQNHSFLHSLGSDDAFDGTHFEFSTDAVRDMIVTSTVGRVGTGCVTVACGAEGSHTLNQQETSSGPGGSHSTLREITLIYTGCDENNNVTSQITIDRLTQDGDVTTPSGTSLPLVHQCSLISDLDETVALPGAQSWRTSGQRHTILTHSTSDIETCNAKEESQFQWVGEYTTAQLHQDALATFPALLEAGTLTSFRLLQRQERTVRLGKATYRMHFTIPEWKEAHGSYKIRWREKFAPQLDGPGSVYPFVQTVDPAFEWINKEVVITPQIGDTEIVTDLYTLEIPPPNKLGTWTVEGPQCYPDVTVQFELKTGESTKIGFREYLRPVSLEKDVAAPIYKREVMSGQALNDANQVVSVSQVKQVVSRSGFGSRPTYYEVEATPEDDEAPGEIFPSKEIQAQAPNAWYWWFEHPKLQIKQRGRTILQLRHKRKKTPWVTQNYSLSDEFTTQELKDAVTTFLDSTPWVESFVNALAPKRAERFMSLDETHYRETRMRYKIRISVPTVSYDDRPVTVTWDEVYVKEDGSKVNVNKSLTHVFIGLDDSSFDLFFISDWYEVVLPDYNARIYVSNIQSTTHPTFCPFDPVLYGNGIPARPFVNREANTIEDHRSGVGFELLTY